MTAYWCSDCLVQLILRRCRSKADTLAVRRPNRDERRRIELPCSVSVAAFANQFLSFPPQKLQNGESAVCAPHQGQCALLFLGLTQSN